MTYLDYLEKKVLFERLVIGLEEPVLVKGLGELQAKIEEAPKKLSTQEELLARLKKEYIEKNIYPFIWHEKEDSCAYQTISYLFRGPLNSNVELLNLINKLDSYNININDTTLSIINQKYFWNHNFCNINFIQII